MKMRKIISGSLLFTSGLVAGFFMLSLFSFTGGPSASAPAGGLTPISVDSANALFKGYMAEAAPMNQVIKGFAMNRAQLEAVNAIAAQNSALTGFRFYLGKNKAGKALILVVGVDNTGKDAVRNSIFATDTQVAGPCPTVCDVTSPITTIK